MIRGIPNYGQTCFLNSVLQALASLEHFLKYLEEIVQVREQRTSSLRQEAFFSRDLLHILQCINGDIGWRDCTIGPREILGHVAKRQSQFAARHQQQDAQELMEALINIVLDDAKSVGADHSSNSMMSSSFVSSLMMEQQEVHTINSPDEILTAGMVVRGGGGGNQQTTIKELDKSVCRNDEEEIQKLGQKTCNGNGHTTFSQTTKIITEVRDDQNSEGDRDFRDTKYCSTPPPGAAPTPVVPFNGWVGSVLRCSKCKYIRPIRNAPFLSVPLVPTSVFNHHHSNTSIRRVPVCSLEQCLSNFTNVEHVNGVECPQCTMQEEIKELKEEQMLLRDAVDSMEKRSRRRNGGEPTASHNNALRKDLSSVEDRLSVLKMAHPDDVYTTTNTSQDDEVLDPLFLPTQGKIMLRSGALKCLTLTRYPKVLCCHVQRLFADPSTGKTEKCAQHVQFPMVLDLGRYCAYSQKADTSWAAGSLFDSKSPQQVGDEKSPVYCLKGVIQHIGRANLGHYVTFRENGRGGWFRISDSTVTPVQLEEVRNCQAYMLFYELNIDNTL